MLAEVASLFLPGLGGTPLTEANSLDPSSENLMLETVPGGPTGGVVSLRFNERWPFLIGIKPCTGSAWKHLEQRSVGWSVKSK